MQKMVLSVHFIASISASVGLNDQLNSTLSDNHSIPKKNRTRSAWEPKKAIIYARIRLRRAKRFPLFDWVAYFSGVEL